jgi:serine/threonine protein kinase/Tfp pilus assembly protein PilF
MLGKIISHYKILEKLGEGGMGVVYKAQDTKLDRIVALKFLPKHLLCDEEAKTRFAHEAKASSALNHTNITTIHEIDEVEGECFICMEYVEGKSIKELIKEKALSIQEILDISIQVAEGLNAAHKKGIVHRDIKSDNIMLTDEGLVKIMDFGLAKLKGVSKLTKTGTTLGTMQYMSPEQAQGIEVDQRSDIFSFGVILYEMITGQLPFKGEHEAAIIYSIISETPEPLARYKANVPKGLQKIMDKAMEKDQEERYQHADDMLADLRKLRKELESTKEQPSTKESQPSIAVLPFTNLSADKEQEYFCDGMAEEIINALTHVEGLRVVARTSAFSFRGEGRDIRDIGKKLNVGTLLEGSVRKAGNRVRITAQLINVSDGYHLWSEKYDRNIGDICCPEDIFAIQDEISLAIVDKLKVKILGEEKTTMVKRYTENLDAYNFYLKGRYFWNKRTETDLKKAIEYFKQAIERDNRYAPAYAGIADSYNDLPDYSSFPPNQAYPRAKEAALKALEIDNTLAEAHASLGLLKTEHEWDWSGAEKEFKRAIELNPACVTAHYWYGLLLSYMGRFDEAIREVRKALELDPLSVLIHKHMAQALFLAGKPDEAMDILRKGMEIEPNSIFLHAMIGLAYSQKSLYEEAIAEFQKEKEIFINSPPIIDTWIGATYAVMGRKDKAQEILHDLLTRSELEYIPPYGLASLYFTLGEKEEGFKWLEKAYEKKDTWLRYIKVDPLERFCSISSDPRFKEFLKKMGLEI